MTYSVGYSYAEDCTFGNTHPPRGRILTDCNPSLAGTHPTSCSCPVTAVSVFYYDFLRLSFFRPRRSSEGPSVSLSHPFPCSQRPSVHTHTRVHTAHQATTSSCKDNGEQEPEVNISHPSALQGPEMRGGRGRGGGVLRKL